MTQGAYLAKEGETVLVKVEGEVKVRLPIHTLGGIVCLGNVTCSPFLMAHCAEHDVALSFLSEHGRFLAAVRGPVSGNVLLRREQYRRADDDACCAAIAIAVITGKIANCRTVLQRTVRDRPDAPGVDSIDRATALLLSELQRLDLRLSLDELRGIEGTASRVYFDVFDYLITTQKDEFCFAGRSRRPPLDTVNALLSFIYTLVMHDVRGALECVGLDPAVGYLHRDRPGRYSLALDVMEEFRPFIADRLVLTLINLRQVSGKDFDHADTGAVMLNEKGRKTVLIAYQSRKKEEILHPFIEEAVEIGLLFHVQAQLLARHLRGDLDAYPPFLWR